MEAWADKVWQACNKLGGHDVAVAKSLWADEVTGIPGNPMACPIANYLDNQGLMDEAWVIGKNIYRWTDGEVQECRLPEATEDFIGGFDSGDFPDLEAKGIYRVWLIMRSIWRSLTSRRPIEL